MERLASPKELKTGIFNKYIQHIGPTRLGTASSAADLTAPPFHRPGNDGDGDGDDGDDDGDDGAEDFFEI